MNVEWKVEKAARAELQFASVSTKEYGYKGFQFHTPTFRVYHAEPEVPGL